MNLLSRLLALQEIRKGKKYVRPGQSPPKGVILHTGKRGGRYYIVEDRHLKIQGKHHELVRGVGVRKDQWDELVEQFKKEGAESIEFINKPDNYRDKEGNPLYNIFVNWGESTQKKIEEKLAADKEKFGKRRESLAKIQAQIDELKKLGENQPIKDFKQAFDDLDNGNKFVRICDIRRKLGWSKEKFDATLEQLWDKEQIHLHAGDVTTMDESQVKDSYTDSNGFLHITVTWEGEEEPEPEEEKKEEKPQVESPPKESISAMEFPSKTDWKEDGNGGFWTESWGVNQDGPGYKTQGILSVKPEGEYSAAIYFTDFEGNTTRLRGRRERELRQDINISEAKLDVELLYRYSPQAIQKELDKDKSVSYGKNKYRIRTGQTNPLGITFADHEEARVWAENNIKSQVTGFSPDLGLDHAAHVLSWLKLREDEIGGAIPGSFHFGRPADWGKWVLGTYYFWSNSIHVRKAQDPPYAFQQRVGNKMYILSQMEKGNENPLPWSASEHEDGVLWHEFGHLLDHLSRRELSNHIASLPNEERLKLNQLSAYPLSYNDQNSIQAEMVAEATSAVFTNSPRAKYVPESLKTAIQEVYKNAKNLQADRNIPDPIHKPKEGTDFERDIFHKVGLTKNPNEFSEDELQDFVRQKTPDELLHIMKHMKLALQDTRLDTEKNLKNITKLEKLRTKSGVERVLTLAGDTYRKNHTPRTIQHFIKDEAWDKTPDGYLSKPFYLRSTDGSTFVENGVLEIRPKGSVGMELFHVDSDGDSHKLFDFNDKRTTSGILDVDKSREYNQHQIGRDYLIGYFYTPGYYESYKKKYELQEAKKKERAKEKKTKPAETESKPKEMSKDLKQFVSRYTGIYSGKRPSELSPDEKEEIINKMSDSMMYMEPSSYASGVQNVVTQLEKEVSKEPSTRSEKILYRKNMDYLNEARHVLDISQKVAAQYLSRIQKQYDAGPITAKYLNYLQSSLGSSIEIPSKYRPTQMNDSMENRYRDRYLPHTAFFNIHSRDRIQSHIDRSKKMLDEPGLPKDTVNDIQDMMNEQEHLKSEIVRKLDEHAMEQSKREMYDTTKEYLKRTGLSKRPSDMTAAEQEQFIREMSNKTYPELARMVGASSDYHTEIAKQRLYMRNSSQFSDEQTHQIFWENSYLKNLLEPIIKQKSREMYKENSL